MKRILSLLLIPASFVMAMQGPVTTLSQISNQSNEEFGVVVTEEFGVVVTDATTNKRKVVLSMGPGDSMPMGISLSRNDVLTVPKTNFRYTPSGRTPAVNLTIYNKDRIEVTPAR